MIIPGDQGPIHEEEGLFRMKDLDTVDKLNKVSEDQEPETIAEDSEDEDEPKPKVPKTEKFGRDKGRLDKSGIFYKDSDSEEAESSSDDSSDEEFIEEKDESDADLGPDLEEPPSPTNPLLMELDEGGVSRKERRAQVLLGIFSYVDNFFCFKM